MSREWNPFTEDYYDKPLRGVVEMLKVVMEVTDFLNECYGPECNPRNMALFLATFSAMFLKTVRMDPKDYFKLIKAIMNAITLLEETRTL